MSAVQASPGSPRPNPAPTSRQLGTLACDANGPTKRAASAASTCLRSRRVQVEHTCADPVLGQSSLSSIWIILVQSGGQPSDLGVNVMRDLKPEELGHVYG